MKDGKNEKSEKFSYILTKETFGTTLMLFCFIVLLMLFSHTAIFASIGGAVCTLMYGTFGYGCLFVVALLAYLGEWMVFGKKFSVRLKKVAIVAVTVFSLFLLLHAVTTNSFPIEGYGKYISDCYMSAQKGYSGYTFGGVISAIFVYPVLAMGGYITAYVIFSLLLLVCAFFTVMTLANKSVLALIPRKQATNSEKKEKKTVKLRKVEDFSVYTPQEEPAESVQNYTREYPQYNYAPEPPAPPVQEYRPAQPAPQPMRYVNEDDDKFSAKNLGRKILFEKGEFAAESYRRNMIFNDNSYFNHPVTNEGDYLSSFASGDKYNAPASNSYSESYQNDVYNNQGSSMPSSYIVGEKPVEEMNVSGNFGEYNDGVYPAQEENKFYSVPNERTDTAEKISVEEKPEEIFTSPAADRSSDFLNGGYDVPRRSSDGGCNNGSDVSRELRNDPPPAEPRASRGRTENAYNFLNEDTQHLDAAPSDNEILQRRGSERRKERGKADIFDDPDDSNDLLSSRPIQENRFDTDEISSFENKNRKETQSRGENLSRSESPDNKEISDSFSRIERADGTDKPEKFNFTEHPTPAESVGFVNREDSVRNVADNHTRSGKSEEKAKAEEKHEEKPKHVWKKYVRPSLDLLDDYPENTNVNTGEIEDNKRIIVEALERYKISSEVANVTIGPSITRYDVIIHDKTNIKRSLGYRDSIAMELMKENVNAYLNYSKGALSIEVPNNRRAIVGLKTMLTSSKFLNSKQNSLTFALGKNVEGEVVCPDITKMPHLLVAGTTGSGKSICLSSLLVSLLYKYGPEELRLILVDPKQVEFISYDKIPHLMINEIIYDTDKAIKALNWAIKEMERRYALFKDMTEAGVATKNLDEYNVHLPDGEEKLPKIVIVLDEFGDLMIQAKKDIESRIIKLVQKARASGIHLILATQRPSVDSITGLIKSNLPTRIGFKVNSFDDSRTIFDVGGAEKLLGKGDAYFRSAENPYLSRIQCCFIDTPEVQKVTDFVKSNNEAYFDQSVSDFINTVESEEPANSMGGGEVDDAEAKIDETYISALKYCVTSNQASVSMIQRRFPVGYIKACKIIDWMENMNYVTPSEGSKPRKVLLSKEEFFNIYGDVDD